MTGDMVRLSPTVVVDKSRTGSATYLGPCTRSNVAVGTEQDAGVRSGVNALPPRPPPSRGRRIGALATGLAVLVSVALGAWLVARDAHSRSLDRSLGAYAVAPPEAGAPIDSALADLGARVFEAGCAACHGITSGAGVGPSLAGVTARRSPEWLMAMVLRPDSMTTSDPVARSLKAQYGVQMMVPGGTTPQRARAVLEFLRRVDGGG